MDAEPIRTPCPVCEKWVETEGEGVSPSVTINGALYHEHCVETDQARGTLRDPRWNGVTDETLVSFDGQLCRFGELSQNEKSMVRITERGCLVGAYPF
jgi:hypothetical protein